MELNLHPIATKCFASQSEFQEGDRVVCYLVREENGQTGRRDLRESEDGKVTLPLEIYCRWVVKYKARTSGEDTARLLKLTAENLFLTLADPNNPPSETNTPLLQFLALMLERKRLIKLRGMSEDGQRQIFEHMPSHQMYEVPAGTLDAAFFVRIQEQLGVLVGEPKPKAKQPEPAPA
ncbi:MAG TPA: hypothetical protein VHD32_06575 [Candidatus Didemnitutus sp.]|nr:hypothetical protein [Candidatus Didemnitutus sp.]